MPNFFPKIFLARILTLNLQKKAICPQNPLSKNLTLNLQSNPFLHWPRAVHSSADSIPEKTPSTFAHSGPRISRLARNEAENALLDYLHFTRCLSFTDAEHISKNSPTFIRYLLSKVENKKEIGHSITRFLRYHPINEFEPLFESLGLKPSEFASLLPRGLMFLSDDQLLLDNLHVLCKYGFLHSEIGNMCKEEREIFRHEDGLLLSKLKAYKELGFSQPTVVKIVASCPSLLVGNVNEDFPRLIVEIEGLGIEKDWIVGCLSPKNKYNWKRTRRLLSFLERMGFKKGELAEVIQKHPNFFFEGSGENMYVLIALLMKLGFHINDITNLIWNFRRDSSPNLAKNFWHGIHFLYGARLKVGDIVRLVHSYPRVLSSCTLKRPKLVKQQLNVGFKRLGLMILEDPNRLRDWGLGMKLHPVSGPTEDELSLLKKTQFLLKLGFVENSKEMLHALKQFRGKGDELQGRFDCLVGAGFERNEVSHMIKLAPPVLQQRQEKLLIKIDLLVNRFGYPLKCLVPYPWLLCYDVGRIKLRFSMCEWLKEKGVTSHTLAMGPIISYSEKKFIKKCVSLHPEGLEVWEGLSKYMVLG
ncbi:transcription termination factor MTEF18, mitochondrial [Amborella trichopoda]|uniref:Uncharacterized protein n=1 Tax=Amborella trichopoda TaxID=13333 RepID=U5CMF9_AMBTC|nr:transcription termination factor MTEF18, mitochondrial [Amborella trichopoda]ERN14326.1 hypothetical protein AMTR_s00033p00200750 [Amborella trichopoda]|eukprot:XP_006852859.1 transcription termination factor MTEF18, mitochondrial [Amborella trichopoda]